MSSLKVVNLNVQKWKFSDDNELDFNRTFFINNNSVNNFTSLVGNGYPGLTMAITNSTDWVRDTITDSSFYYDSNTNNALDNGEQLGYKLSASLTDTFKIVTINGISNSGIEYHYLLFSSDNTSNSRTVYFNFFDSIGNNINTELGYLTDTDTNAVNCIFSEGSSTYMVQIAHSALLDHMTIQFQNFEYVYGSINIVFAGLVSTTNNYVSANFPCFIGSTQILMADKTYKNIKNLKRGDMIIEDIVTNKINKIADVPKHTAITQCYEIKQNLIGNSETLICTNHPIWCNNNENRIFPSNINGVITVQKFTTFYDIQFEEEGTFIANNVKVDSLSPNHRYMKLEKDLFFNTHKFTEYIVQHEDDPIRNKPNMTKNAHNFLSNKKTENSINFC